MNKLLGYIIITISFVIGIYGGFWLTVVGGILFITNLTGLFNILLHLVGLMIAILIIIFMSLFVFGVGLKFLEE
jgi:hypothetical protein